eukprot:764000-Hanusia_phi.AAC.6
MRNQSSLTYRWVMFERFLDLQGKKYRRVLLADVVQVAFQSSPFDILTGEGLYAFSESISLSQDVWTTNWIRACFESSVLAQLGNKETLNVGYVTGTIDRILPYVRVMAATVRNVTRADGCRGEGVDQGVHNVVAYTDASASDLVVQNQNQGAVAELQSPFAMTYNAGIRAVVNGMGKPAAVVLRYYNVPEVMRLLFHSYVEWDVHNVSRGRGGCWRLVGGEGGVAAGLLRAVRQEPDVQWLHALRPDVLDEVHLTGAEAGGGLPCTGEHVGLEDILTTRNAFKSWSQIQFWARMFCAFEKLVLDIVETGSKACALIFIFSYCCGSSTVLFEFSIMLIAKEVL